MSDPRLYENRVWRLVEAQHHVSTLKLVNRLAEQSVLEDLIEKAKPPVPVECRGLHYLLSTPFRYDAPYPIGSRFRRAGRTAGVFYAAEAPETAVAEMAFYRLLFLTESPLTPWPVNPFEMTAFSAAIRTERALDLTLAPLAAASILWRDPVEYAPVRRSLTWAAQSAPKPFATNPSATQRAAPPSPSWSARPSPSPNRSNAKPGRSASAQRARMPSANFP
jgi:hypothetical protein